MCEIRINVKIRLMHDCIKQIIIFERIITSNISPCMWPMIGLPCAVRIRGGTFEGPGPKRYLRGASSGRSMHAGGGTGSVDALLAPEAPSTLAAAAACWRSGAPLLNKALCIMLALHSDVHVEARRGGV